jgi:hypothetical protein
MFSFKNLSINTGNISLDFGSVNIKTPSGISVYPVGGA